MTAPVDVLAVMDFLAQQYVANRGTCSQFICVVTPGVHGDDDALRNDPVGAAWLDLFEARAAVAELIKAADGVDATHGPMLNPRAVTPKQRQIALDRLRAALARVQGGAL
jgi:hypothetical protein